MITCLTQICLLHLTLCGGFSSFCSGKFHVTVVISQIQEQSPLMPLPQPGQEKITGFFHLRLLVPKVVKHLKFSETDGTLVMPHWESAPWWPLLIQKKGVFKSFITDVFVIPPERTFLFQQYQETSFLVQGSKV